MPGRRLRLSSWIPSCPQAGMPLAACLAMRNDQKAISKAVFVVPPKLHLLDMAGPAQIFQQAASGGAPIELLFCSIFKGSPEAVSSSPLSFNHLVPFDQLKLTAGDIAFVPGLETALFLDRKFIEA